MVAGEFFHRNSQLKVKWSLSSSVRFRCMLSLWILHSTRNAFEIGMNCKPIASNLLAASRMSWNAGILNSEVTVLDKKRISDRFLFRLGCHHGKFLCSTRNFLENSEAGKDERLKQPVSLQTIA